MGPTSGSPLGDKIEGDFEFWLEMFQKGVL